MMLIVKSNCFSRKHIHKHPDCCTLIKKARSYTYKADCGSIHHLVVVLHQRISRCINYGKGGKIKYNIDHLSSVDVVCDYAVAVIKRCVVLSIASN